MKDDTIESVVAKLIAGLKTNEEKISAIFYFVRDEIKFGWVYPQDVSADEILKSGRGVCMQKSNLLVAMAREAGLMARFHFMIVRKNAIQDFVPKFAYDNWADVFPHTLPEIFINGKWVSMEPTIDKELHEICLKQNINFARQKDIAQNVSMDFSIDGVKGHQQYWHVDGKEPFYGNNLSELTKFMNVEVPFWKKMLLPIIFFKAQKICDKLRLEHRNNRISGL